MMHGKAMRIGFLALAVSAPAAAAAQTATDPEIAANVAQLLDWIDGGLAQGAAASSPASPSTPALGEGPVGQALGWLFGGEPQSASIEAAEAPEPEPGTPQPATARVAAPVTTPAIASMDPPEDEPLTLTQQPRAVATVRPQGLLLPVASP